MKSEEMAESNWLSCCASMFKDRNQIHGVSWIQFLTDTYNILNAAKAEGVPADCEFAVCFMSSLIITHCDDSDANLPITYFLVDKTVETIIHQLKYKEDLAIKEMYCHCLCLLLNSHSSVKYSKHCCTPSVIDIFKLCHKILLQKSTDDSFSFSEVIKSNEKTGARSGFVMSNLSDVLSRYSKDLTRTEIMKRIVRSTLRSKDVGKHLCDIVCSLELYRLPEKISLEIIEGNWSSLVKEFNFLTAVLGLPAFGRKGVLEYCTISLFNEPEAPESCKDYSRSFYVILDICLLLLSTPQSETSSLIAPGIYPYLSLWIKYIERTATVLSSRKTIVNLNVVAHKLNVFFDNCLQNGTFFSDNTVFCTALLDFARILEIFVGNSAVTDSDVSASIIIAKCTSTLLESFQHLAISFKDQSLLDIPATRTGSDLESDIEDQNPEDIKNCGFSDFEGSYIDDDDRELPMRGMAAKKTKSSSQDDPCTSIFNLFELDDQLAVPSDFKSQPRSPLNLTSIVNMVRAFGDTSLMSKLNSTSFDDQEIFSKYFRMVTLGLGVKLATIIQKMDQPTVTALKEHWKIESFGSLSVSMRTLCGHSVNRQRASIFNVIEYVFLALVQQRLITRENCVELFTADREGKSDFWLANVDPLMRQLVFVFLFNLSSSDFSTMTSFVHELWVKYLDTVSKLSLQNFNQNNVVLSVSLAQDMLDYFYLLPFTEKRLVIAKICSSLCQLVSELLSLGHSHLSLLLALASTALNRFVYELPEKSLKSRVIFGPLEENRKVVSLSTYYSECNRETVASFETMNCYSQLKLPPSLDRLGLASFCGIGQQNYLSFYSALLKICDPSEIGQGIGVNSVSIKISAIWNTWLGTWYLLPVLPPPIEKGSELTAVDALKGPNKIPDILLFTSMATLLLRENTSYNAWMKDAFSKMQCTTAPSGKNVSPVESPWNRLKDSFTIANLLKVTAIFMKEMAAAFKQIYLPFSVDSKIPETLPSLPYLFSIQVVICNVNKVLSGTSKDFDKTSVCAILKDEHFSNFLASSLELFEWILYIVKFAASRIVQSDEANDCCLHLRSFLGEHGASDSHSDANVFDQLISKAGARSNSAAGFQTGESEPTYYPLLFGVELKHFILNPYFRHLYCVYEMFLQLYQSMENCEEWKSIIVSEKSPVSADLFNSGIEPTFTSAVFEAQPYLLKANTLGATFKDVTEILANVFGEEWIIANNEYLLSLSHRLIFALSESSAVGSIVGTQKSVSLKKAALKCIESLLPVTKPMAVVWQRTYAHASSDSCNLGRILLSCNEANLQGKAVGIVCQVLLAASKSEFEQELSGVVSTIESISDENSIMFVLMSLLSRESKSGLEDLLSSLSTSSSVVGTNLFFNVLDCLLRVCNEALNSGDFVAVTEHIFPSIMVTARAIPNGEGHVKTMGLMQQFLETCRKTLSEYEIKEDAPIATTATLLVYIYRVISAASITVPSLLPKTNNEIPGNDDLLKSLFHPLGQSPTQPFSKQPASGQQSVGAEPTDCDDEDEEDLDSKLCTFTQSHKTFMNQHWYHCYTCSMTDGFGVCTVCAKVCHKDHDLAYAKLSSFFCDCGAKEDNSCRAKVRRIAGSARNTSTPQQVDQPSTSSSQQPSIAARFGRLGVLARGRPPFPVPSQPPQQSQAVDLRKPSTSFLSSKTSSQPATQLTPSSSSILSETFVIACESSAEEIVDVIEKTELKKEVMLALSALCGLLSSDSVCLAKKCRMELSRLSTPTFWIRIGPTLMADQSHIELTSDFKFDGHKVFESDKTRLKQLVESGKIRPRLVACNALGNLGYYAIVQSRNRLDLFSLPHLVQAASSLNYKTTSRQRKYQPHKLGCLSLPFSLAGVEVNRESDSLLAVYGTSDVEVVVLSSSHMAREQLAIQVQLESQQSYIVGCRWLPGSLTVIGVVLDDCIKIFDTAVDVMKPIYHFLLPSWTIADLAFAVYSENEKYALILGTNGHIYVQQLSSDVGAQSGPFYVTSVVLPSDNADESIPSAWRNPAETVADGGLSIAYSHRLQMLTVSCASAVFMLPKFMPKIGNTTDILVDNIVTVVPKSEREEWVFHSAEMVDMLVPGFLLGTTNAGNAVAYSIRPEEVTVTISDSLNSCSACCSHYFVAPLQNSNGSSRLICIFGVSNEGKLIKIDLDVSQIDQWMNYSSPVTPNDLALLDCDNSTDKQAEELKQSCPPKVTRTSSGESVPPPVPRRSSTSSRTGSYAAAASAAVVKFPIDFFENCQPSTNVEFGGTQLLYVYNNEQLKSRLSPVHNNKYVVSPAPFSLSVTNRTVGTLLAGVRIQLGGHRLDRVPQFIRLFDRTVTVNCQQQRWFDCPFTRSEALAARNKAQIYFGPSSSGTVIVDSVLVHVKTREELGCHDRDVDSPPQLAPIFASLANKKNDEGISRNLIHPSVYITPSAQLSVLACIGILRRLNGDLMSEKVFISLLKTPSSLEILQTTLSWLLSNANVTTSQVRSIVQRAASNVEIVDAPHFELLLLLNSFLVLTNKRPEEPAFTCSADALENIVSRYNELSFQRPFSWSTTSISKVELSRSLTFPPYLVLLLLEAIGKPRTSKMLFELLSNTNIDESFVAQQALDLFYFSGSSSPWSVVTNSCAPHLDVELSSAIPATAAVDKIHVE